MIGILTIVGIGTLYYVLNLTNKQPYFFTFTWFAICE